MPLCLFVCIVFDAVMVGVCADKTHQTKPEEAEYELLLRDYHSACDAAKQPLPEDSGGCPPMEMPRMFY